MSEEPEHLTTNQARAATGSKDTKVVLTVSLILVVAIFALLLFVAR